MLHRVQPEQDPDEAMLFAVAFNPAGDVAFYPGCLFGPEHVDLMVEVVGAAKSWSAANLHVA